jgi:hypothetical protein
MKRAVQLHLIPELSSWLREQRRMLFLVTHGEESQRRHLTDNAADNLEQATRQRAAGSEQRAATG